MVKASHNNVNVIIHIAVLKVTSTVVFVGLRTFTMGEECTVSLRDRAQDTQNDREPHTPAGCKGKAW